MIACSRIGDAVNEGRGFLSFSPDSRGSSRCTFPAYDDDIIPAGHRAVEELRRSRHLSLPCCSGKRFWTRLIGSGATRSIYRTAQRSIIGR